MSKTPGKSVPASRGVKKVATKPSVSVRAKKTTATASTSKKTLKKPDKLRAAIKSKATKSAKNPLTTTRKAAVTNKSVSKKSSATKESSKKSTDTQRKRTANSSSKVVLLPARMSIRAREKALVLMDAFEKDMMPVFHTSARAAGIGFLTIGALVVFGTLGTFSKSMLLCDTVNCSAQIIQSQVSSSSISESTSQDPVGSVHDSVDLISTIPDLIERPTEIEFYVSNPKEVKAAIFATSNPGEEIQQQVRSVNENIFFVVIEPERIPYDQYELKVFVRHINNPDYYKPYLLGDFAISTPVDDSETDPSTIQNEDPSDDSTDLTSPVVNSETADIESDSTELLQITTIKDATDDSLDTVLKTETAQEPSSEVDTTDEDTIATEKEIASLERVVITSKDVLSGVATINIKNGSQYDGLRLFLRPIKTLNSQLVGRVLPSLTSYNFNTSNFPNGQYEMYIQSRTGIDNTQSNSIIIQIKNLVAETEQVTTESQDSQTTNQDTSETPLDHVVYDDSQEQALDGERELLRISTEPTSLNDYDVNQNTDDDADNSLTLDNDLFEPVRIRAIEKMTQSSEELDILFAAYSSAQQTGDEALIVAAREKIDEFRESLVQSALEDERDRFIVKELDESLVKELDNFKKRVETFESVRRDRTASSSAIDTDGDGISDVDERLLYKTNPELADTDGDGFLDGVEIIGGFDPLSDQAEAVIRYQSPKESLAVIKTETLKVTEVLPQVRVADAEQPQEVQATVRGQGLPNSFVTLYVFSTPTIVTVRTDDTGAFEYTFSKELEDGEHQVFVALTDNTGDIVAQSEPFTFVKQAQAFTPVDAQASAAEETSFVDTDVVAGSPYRVVLGMSVLALGILLILLGIGLRANRPDEEIIKETENGHIKA